MYILIALIVTVVAGIAVHFATPHHDQLGVALAPAIAGGLCGALYGILTWLGVGEGSILQWLIALIVPVVVAAAVAAPLARARHGREATALAAIR
ncbi:MAG: hypothetical protein QM607_01885 [Microbacterium sp.]